MIFNQKVKRKFVQCQPVLNTDLLITAKNIKNKNEPRLFIFTNKIAGEVRNILSCYYYSIYHLIEGTMKELENQCSILA